MATDMSNQLLRCPDIRPTAEIIAAGLGDSNDAFVKFAEDLGVYGISLMEWRYYNDGKAWLSKGEYKWTTARGTDKVKPIFWLSVWEGFFRVAFFFSFALCGDLLNLPVCETTKDIIKNAKPMGKTMRFVPIVIDVTGDTPLDDLYAIAQFKKTKG